MKKLDKITHDMAERKLADDIIAKEQKLNKMLLDSLPHPAMLIRCKDKVVLAANSVAFAIGVKVGGQCWRDFGKAAFISQKDKELLKKYPDYVPAEYGVRCSFCQGDECFSEVPKQNNPEIRTFDKIWDVYWIKVDEDIYLHYAIDITEHKRAEEEIESQAKFPSENPYPVLRIHGDGTVQYANKASEPLLKAKDSGVGRPAPKEWRRLVKAVLASGRVAREEAEHDGHVFAFRAVPIVESGYVNFYGVDITERKEVEETLKRERDNFISIFEVMEDGVYIVDQQYDIQYVNPSLQKEYGPWKGVKCYTYFHDRTEICPWCPNQKVFAGETVRWEWYSEKNGKTYDLIDTPLKSSDGRILKLEIFRNITERKQAEKKLAGYQHQLRAMSSKLLLAEDHQRRQIAAKLHDSIGQDLALSMLKLDTLKKSVSSKDIAAELDKVKKTLEKTIQDTRTLSFDLSSPTLYRFGFVRAIEQWISEQVQGKHGIKAAFVENGKIGPLDEDVGIVLFQAAREVLINVIKHARAKSVKVSIRPTDGKIETIIEDDGAGFDTSEIGSFVHKSSGFGLFNIRERLNYLGGDIKIESRPGHGTRITLIAPLQIEENRGRQQI